ncbi:MAG: cytochrome P450 [Anaerolineales bacterium]|jgi:cytochrome P450
MAKLEAQLIAPPVPDSQAGRRALGTLLRGGNILSALETIHAEMGDVFRIPLPGFNPLFLVGPEANRFVTVTGREDLRWRPEGDPVARLLRDGLLVTDGDFHDELRRKMAPALHKQMLSEYLEIMWRRTDQISGNWDARKPVDMLAAMRKIALLILMDALFAVDFSADMPRLWASILKTLQYISPGLWVVWPGLPRPGYRRALQQMDAYLYRLIKERREKTSNGNDLLGLLIRTPGMGDDLIRDQLLTMLIAGHDTSTALLAWALYLFGRYPEVMQRAQDEVDRVIGWDRADLESINQLEYLDLVIKEVLRLYPPIHIGNRRAATDLEFQGYRIPSGQRVVYSIYLTHRMPEYWPDPQRFDPQRFSPEQARLRPHYAYVPFGGGPRNCIGFAFAQVEVKIVLARLLQKFCFELTPGEVHAHMGATLEPRPGVLMYARPRIKTKR